MIGEEPQPGLAFVAAAVHRAQALGLADQGFFRERLAPVREIMAEFTLGFGRFSTGEQELPSDTWEAALRPCLDTSR